MKTASGVIRAPKSNVRRENGLGFRVQVLGFRGWASTKTAALPCLSDSFFSKPRLQSQLHWEALRYINPKP